MLTILWNLLNICLLYTSDAADDTPAGKQIKAEVPLDEMFGYATDLRSMSQGRANYSMEFAKYTAAPRNIADEVIEKLNT